MKFSSYLLSIALVLSIASCQQIECEEFNFAHPMMAWHGFPDSKEQYTYIDQDANTIEFQRTKFEYSKYEKRWCHMCACFRDLETAYSCAELNMQWTSMVSYSDFNDHGSLNLNIEKVNSMFDVVDDAIKESVYGSSDTAEFKVIKVDSLILHNSVYLEVIQLIPYDSVKANVKILWLKKNAGIIGFESRGRLWRRI